MPLRPANPSENRPRRLQGSDTLIWIRGEAFQIEVHLLEGEHLLICKHVFENHYRGRLHVRRGKDFNREDGSAGSADFTLFCPVCFEIPPTDVDCHEWVWRDGKFWLADRLPKTANETGGEATPPAGGTKK